MGHDWQDATCEAPKTCARCGLTEGSALGHDEVIDATEEATCTENGLTEGTYCPGCGLVYQQQEIPAARYSFGDWTVKTQPTAEAEGEELRTCADCGETESRAIAKLPADKNNTPQILAFALIALVGIGTGVVVFLLRKKRA